MTDNTTPAPTVRRLIEETYSQDGFTGQGIRRIREPVTTPPEPPADAPGN